MDDLYTYGQRIEHLTSLQSRVVAGISLLEHLIKQDPIDIDRIQHVADTVNHNNKILNGGI